MVENALYKTDSIKPYESCFKQLLGRQDILHGCDVGYTKVYLRYTGDINVCSLDSANKSVVGNIKNESLKSLIDKQEAIVLNLKRNVPECCKDCFM